MVSLKKVSLVTEHIIMLSKGQYQPQCRGSNFHAIKNCRIAKLQNKPNVPIALRLIMPLL